MHTPVSLFALLLSVVPLATADHVNHARNHRELAKRLPEPGPEFNVTSNNTLTKRAQFNNARFTFFDVGLGACGQYSHRNDFMVALTDKQFGGGYPGPNCFKKITISYGGKTAQATILDECPGCPYGGLDFSRGLFDYFAPESAGVIYGSWSFSGHGDPEPAPVTTKKRTTKAAPTTTKKNTYTPPPPKPTPTPKPTSTSTKVKPTSTSSDDDSTTTSKASSSKATPSSTKVSSSKAPASSSSESDAPSSSTIDYNDGPAAGLATPTGTPGKNNEYALGLLNTINEAILGLGALVVAGGDA